MIDTDRLFGQIPNRQTLGFELESHPTKEDIRTVVQRFKSDGIRGRRIAEDANTDFCIRKRRSEYSRLRGGCKGSQ